MGISRLVAALQKQPRQRHRRPCNWRSSRRKHKHGARRKNWYVSATLTEGTIL